MEDCNMDINERFDSIHQMLAALGSRSANTVFSGYSLSSETGDEDFTGTKSWNEAMGLIANGWPEPLDEIKRGVANHFKSREAVQKNRPQTGVVGYTPCVPNAIMGLPNSMIMTDKTPQKVKAVTIIFAVGVNCGTSATTIRRAGINVLNIVNDLELAGYRVKLNVEFFAATEGSDFCSVQVTVKDWRQPLDLKKLCFPIANPSMFRRFGFRWLETVPTLTNRGYRSGYGSSSFKSDYKEAVDFYKKKNLLADNEYLITTYLCKEKRFDVKEITNACGISATEKKETA